MEKYGYTTNMLFDPAQDNISNFLVQLDRDRRFIDAACRYGTLDMRLLQCLFPQIGYRVLAQRMQRLSEPCTIRKGLRTKKCSTKKAYWQKVGEPAFKRWAAFDGRAIYSIAPTDPNSAPQWEHNIVAPVVVGSNSID